MMKREFLPCGIGTNLEKPVVDINALIKLKLPPLNRTVMRISELLRSENVTTRQLADVAGCDPVLATRLLKLANSSLYFRRIPVSSIYQAIEALGRKALYDMVMLGAMADGFAREISNSVYGRIIWEHSIVVALVSRELSSILGMRGTEEAFLCGLLHDIGRILLLKSETEKIESIINCPTESEMLEAEEEVFGFTHAEIGAYVTHKWELPETVCAVIMHHHKPRLANISAAVTNIVNVADFIANANGYGLRLEEKGKILDSDSAKILRLDAERLDTVWTNTQTEIREVLLMFH